MIIIIGGVLSTISTVSAGQKISHIKCRDTSGDSSREVTVRLLKDELLKLMAQSVIMDISVEETIVHNDGYQFKQSHNILVQDDVVLEMSDLKKIHNFTAGVFHNLQLNYFSKNEDILCLEGDAFVDREEFKKRMSEIRSSGLPAPVKLLNTGFLPNFYGAVK